MKETVTMRPYVVLIGVTLLVFTTVGVFKFAALILEDRQVIKSYPSFHKNAQHYHSTREIYDAVLNDNELNPFYTSHNLLPNNNSSSALELYGYGPLGDPIDKKVRVLIVCGQHGRELGMLFLFSM